jgi:hypothetical protein
MITRIGYEMTASPPVLERAAARQVAKKPPVPLSAPPLPIPSQIGQPPPPRTEGPGGISPSRATPHHARWLQIAALDRPASVPRTTGRRQEMTGTAGASNPQVRKQIRPSLQVARSAPRTLSRWRRGFEPRWDYAGQRLCPGIPRASGPALAPRRTRGRHDYPGPTSHLEARYWSGRRCTARDRSTDPVQPALDENATPVSMSRTRRAFVHLRRPARPKAASDGIRDDLVADYWNLGPTEDET